MHKYTIYKEEENPSSPNATLQGILVPDEPSKLLSAVLQTAKQVLINLHSLWLKPQHYGMAVQHEIQIGYATYPVHFALISDCANAKPEWGLVCSTSL